MAMMMDNMIREETMMFRESACRRRVIPLFGA
jgi:hypothetical protein